MANIVLCRIDSRLIHGQVVTKWVGQSQANRIAVVSDELDADPFMKNIYLMAAPPNIKVDCFGNQSFAAAWKENQLGDGNVLVLFPSLAAVQDAIQLGFDVTRIQVGGLGGGPNRKAVFQNITGTVAKLAMRQPFVLFKGLTFQKLCLPGAFRPGDHHNK
ncbi:PTS sugar transporter subunit IIB, partial [Salmonella enterica]|uniref:PTS sugar transporter subunit IIB n=1 Tax=Salmonella enterica TaxID=28901 RepID=UPI001FF2FD22